MNEKMEVKIKNLDEFNRLLDNLKIAIEAVNNFELNFEVTLQKHKDEISD